MTQITHFDPQQDLIYVEGSIEGLRKRLEVRLALDTGAYKSLVVPDVIEKLG